MQSQTPVFLTEQGCVATLARLMPGLPQYVDPLRLAEAGESITGRMAVSAMPRLRELLQDDSGAVEFRVDFRRERQGLVRIVGEFSTSLRVVCQRCLEPFAFDVAGAIDVVPVASGEDARELPAGAEPLALNDGRLHLPAFIEDEVLLGLPLAPVHAREDCAGRRPAARPVALRQTPFAALRDLNIGKK